MQKGKRVILHQSPHRKTAGGIQAAGPLIAAVHLQQHVPFATQRGQPVQQGGHKPAAQALPLERGVYRHAEDRQGLSPEVDTGGARQAALPLQHSAEDALLQTAGGHSAIAGEGGGIEDFQGGTVGLLCRAKGDRDAGRGMGAAVVHQIFGVVQG